MSVLIVVACRRLKSTITASSFVKDLKKKGANIVAETITEKLKSKSSQYQVGERRLEG